MLTDGELEQLNALLLAIPMDRDGMLLSEFDGFCAGLIVSPDMIMPSEWLPLVWGAGNAPFDELSDVRSATNLIMHHYNDVTRMLTPPRSDYAPLYDEDTVTDEILWEPWVWGFEQAMRLRPEAWETIVDSADAEASASVTMMLALYDIAENRSELSQASVDELTERAPDLIPDLVMALNDWTKGRSLSLGLSANANQMPVAGRKVGRNDPCPCGSGRKYKWCCRTH